MSLGMSQMYSDSLSAALDEVYVYASALDASDIEVLYGSVSAAPTVTPVPTSHLFEGSLVAYYPFVDGTTQDAHHSWHGTPETMTTTEGSGRALTSGSAIVLDAERRRATSVTLPPEATQDVLSDADRTVCLWARIDERAWKGGCLFLRRRPPVAETLSLNTKMRLMSLGMSQMYSDSLTASALDASAVAVLYAGDQQRRRRGVQFVDDDARRSGVATGAAMSCVCGRVSTSGKVGACSITLTPTRTAVCRLRGGATRRLAGLRILLVRRFVSYSAGRNCDGRGPHGRVCGADIWQTFAPETSRASSRS